MDRLWGNFKFRGNMKKRTWPTTKNNSRNVGCPICGSKAGEKCVDKDGFVMRISHRARTAYWRMSIGDSLDHRELQATTDSRGAR